jgi:hypothetical protein
MYVQIDETGHDVEATHIDNSLSRRRVQSFAHGDDLTVGDGHVVESIDAIVNIHDVPTSQ